jgi:hypothetical protein
MVMSINTHAGAYVALRTVKLSKSVRVITPTTDEHPPKNQRQADDFKPLQREKKSAANAGPRQSESV